MTSKVTLKRCNGKWLTAANLEDGTEKRFSVVEFLQKPPSPTSKYVVVPDTWINPRSYKIGVLYPRIKDKEIHQFYKLNPKKSSYLNWTEYLAISKYNAKSLNDAKAFVTKNVKRDGNQGISLEDNMAPNHNQSTNEHEEVRADEGNHATENNNVVDRVAILQEHAKQGGMFMTIYAELWANLDIKYNQSSALATPCTSSSSPSTSSCSPSTSSCSPSTSSSSPNTSSSSPSTSSSSPSTSASSPSTSSSSPSISSSSKNKPTKTVLVKKRQQNKSFKATGLTNNAQSLDLLHKYDKIDFKWTLRHHEPKPGIDKLIDGFEIYVDSKELGVILTCCKNSKQLVRALLPEIFNEEALSTCTIVGPRNSSNGRPGLNKEGRNALLHFVRSWESKKGWPPMTDNNFNGSIRYKLTEMRKLRDEYVF